MEYFVARAGGTMAIAGAARADMSLVDCLSTPLTVAYAARKCTRTNFDIISNYFILLDHLDLTHKAFTSSVPPYTCYVVCSTWGPGLPHADWGV